MNFPDHKKIEADVKKAILRAMLDNGFTLDTDDDGCHCEVELVPYRDNFEIETSIFFIPLENQ